MKSKGPKSPSRKREVLKKLFSVIIVLNQENENGEFNNLIVEANIILKKYGIDKLVDLASAEVIDLKKYIEERDKL